MADNNSSKKIKEKSDEKDKEKPVVVMRMVARPSGKTGFEVYKPNKITDSCTLN